MINISAGSHSVTGAMTSAQSWRSSHAHRTGHHHHDRHIRDGEDVASTGRSSAIGSPKQALVNQISVTLTQRFDLQVSSLSIAGASPDEQAGNDLATVVSSALNSLSDSPATEAVAQVDDATSEAIQQTAQDIEPGGSGASDLGDAIAQLTTQLQSLFNAFLTNAGSTQGSSSVAESGARLISRAKGTLEIHTQEGDVVKLAFASKNGISVNNIGASDGTTRLGSTDIQAFSKNRVTMSVQGNLNADELQAIQDLVDQVNTLADEFFTGDINAALSQSGSLTFDNAILSDYSLGLSLKQTFKAYGLILNLPTPEPTGTDTPAAAPDAPTQDETAPATTSDQPAANEPPETGISASLGEDAVTAQV